MNSSHYIDLIIFILNPYAPPRMVLFWHLRLLFPSHFFLSVFAAKVKFRGPTNYFYLPSQRKHSSQAQRQANIFYTREASRRNGKRRMIIGVALRSAMMMMWNGLNSLRRAFGVKPCSRRCCVGDRGQLQQSFEKSKRIACDCEACVKHIIECAVQRRSATPPSMVKDPRTPRHCSRHTRLLGAVSRLSRMNRLSFLSRVSLFDEYQSVRSCHGTFSTCFYGVDPKTSFQSRHSRV